MLVPQIEIAEFAGLPAEAVVIDVRETDEYEAGHVPGAMLIPLSEVPDRFGEIPSGGRVHVICHSGGRSQRAAEFLAGEGIDAVNVGGGTKAWIDSGREVIIGSDSRRDQGG